MAYNVLSGTVKQLHSSSIALTGTFTGDGSDLAFPNSQVPEYVITPDDNRLITFTNTVGKALRGEANLTFDGSNLVIAADGTTKIVLDNVGNVSASANMSASYFYGDGRYLTGITASAGGSASAKGPVGSLQFQTGSGTISGSGALMFFTASSLLALTGGISASANISASYFYGDGRYLTGITASGGGSASAQGPIGALQFQTGSGGFSGSTLVLYDFTNDVLTLRSGLVHARTAVTTNHTAAVNEYYLGVRAASVEILFDATQCVDGQTYIIKDEVGSASLGTAITLLPSGSQTIDNNLTVTIDSPYGAANLYTDGVNWFVY
jgi:hypothetical protein